MSDELPPRVTLLLVAWSEGDREALAELMPLVCDELRRMARRYCDGRNARAELQPTALVNEFFLHLESRRTVSWKNRRHFFGYAAEIMRRLMVDQARRHGRRKRGGDEKPVSLGQLLEPPSVPAPSLDVLALHEVLGRLEARDSRAAEVVKLRFFVGMTVPETAAALDISPAAVKRDWKFARLWLFKKLTESREQDGSDSDPDLGSDSDSDSQVDPQTARSARAAKKDRVG